MPRKAAVPSGADSETVLTRLHGLHPKGIDLSLDRLTGLLAKMGNPHEKLPRIIHVAGTNGKGSTTAFMRAILEAAGLRVHVYSSPHLVRFHERIRIAGELIAEQELCDRLLAAEAANDGAPITFFEITSAAAFAAFADHQADITLLEVGLGGRFDTTNVIPTSAVSVITPVDLDHQEFLGNDLATIAHEKAGILRPHVPAIIGPQQPQAEAAIRAEVDRLGALALWHGQDWLSFNENGRLIFQYRNGLLDLPLPGLPGNHQLINAGAAIAALLALEDAEFPQPAIAHGLTHVNWPGRLQKLDKGALCRPLNTGSELWLDGGHNPAAGRVLAAALADMEERHPKPLFLICGMLANKDAAGFLENFQGLATAVHTVPVPGEASGLPADRLAATARKLGFQSIAHDNAATAIAIIQNERPDHDVRIVICGSLYLAGAILKQSDYIPR
ncbi:MAG TPA: bifunctional folylpolyglutamate synthase/dihydrofolate synthase [Alphaproteobacteria bacterium]|nr:bifunctional folylpolyglutamate synthase/dihydrofolate synthase [Alphaproteobacteria bacterium]